jgi:iron complex outermembrane receptor protein
MLRFRFALPALLLAASLQAHDFSAGSITIGHPWSRPTASGMPMGVAYFTLTNRGKTEDALTAAETPVAARVEFHQTQLTDGIARMRPLTQIVIAPGKTVKVEPGGIHIMLVELNRALEAGDSIPMTLTFRIAGKVEVRIKVESRDVAGLENEMTRTLGTVTVVARRPSTLPTSIPTTVEGITAATLARNVNAIDSEDALKYFPSLNVRKRYTGDFDHAVLASRASGSGNSARSLVYADGILLSNLLGNGATFTPRWGMVTPDEIERVDVLYGPFSAAYPGNSVGAVVDYVTRMPERLEIRGALSRFSEDFGSYGHDRTFGGWQASASAGDARGATSWWVNFNRLDSESHPIAYATKLLSAGATGSGGTPVTGAVAARNPRNQDWWLIGATNAIHTVQDHAKLKVAHDFSEQLRLSYTFGWWRNGAERESQSWLLDAAGSAVWSGPVNLDGRVFNIGASEMARASADLSHLMHGLSIRRRAMGNWDLEGTASLYSYERDETRSPDVPMPGALTAGDGRIADQSGTGWTTLSLRALRRDIGPHILEFGVQDDRYRLRSAVRETDDWQRGAAGARVAAFRGVTRLTSVYAQDSFEFARDWQATLGARVEWWSADNGAIANASTTEPFPARSDTWLSPKAALAVALSTDWSLKASVGRAIRMPTVSELFQGSIVSNTIVNNDPDLAPERSWTSELSAVGEFDHGDLRSTLFFEDTRDALYSQVDVLGGGTVTTIQNVGHIRTRGVEISAHRRALATLEFSASVTWTHSRILENDNNPASVGRWQPRVPEWRATALASWRPSESFSATLGARYSGLQFNQLDNSDVHGASYTGMSRFLVADVRLRYQAAHWTAAVGVDNLGNERYWAFHPYSRRSYSAELTATL